MILLSVHIKPLEKEYQIQAEKNMKGGITLYPNEQKVNTRDKVANDLYLDSPVLTNSNKTEKI